MVINILVTYSCWQVAETNWIFHLCHIFFRLLAPRGQKSLNFNIPGSNIYQHRLKYNIIWFGGVFWAGNHLEISWIPQKSAESIGTWRPELHWYRSNIDVATPSWELLGHHRLKELSSFMLSLLGVWISRWFPSDFRDFQPRKHPKIK